MKNATLKYNLEHRIEDQNWCALIVLICWALIVLAVVIMLAIAIVHDVCKNYPRTEIELTAFYPDPVCEFCGAVMDGTEHRCDEPHSTASTASTF